MGCDLEAPISLGALYSGLLALGYPEIHMHPHECASKSAVRICILFRMRVPAPHLVYEYCTRQSVVCKVLYTVLRGLSV
jgi:hypothetical protein